MPFNEFVFIPLPQHIFKRGVLKIPGSSLYVASDNEIKGSEMAISKKSTRVLKATDFKKIVCPPTSTLKLKVLMLKF
jgi:hypothetical protein